MREYICCVIANRFTLLGYVSLIILIVVLAINTFWLDLFHAYTETFIGVIILLFFAACFLLMATGFGFLTYDYFKRTLKIIKHRGHLPNDLKNYESQPYCVSVGIRLALQQAGMNDLLR
ncbi:MAG: hypothetical protein A3G49_04225 [Candidatus Sungbacteria bacterium RIFCSPLOWO2_12_FULL_41_11]|uniref:Uncharacterized protein n=1 Tax=Candidatus Sungbacteria bacterium RIFCSPLOWO2_12_FULL_41_11 TaxID=1802286 RepID=A0A1G2LTD0_9BACT|nr:MAG: hypothetical protein UV01_C0010G0022 [Parcubacteria group bacterium GW2011_GWA2_42_14]OGZ97261.1 MAG: hypothetical protein A3D41_01370 [Candidatus Sungbacteria bacterium RIFCSPHIGHO2_02_FULL_41_12b]OHA14867.1 MAG: hypothetical protein A3G49_04225 [Candidatus Sungbacteria bacterium RIFCSPLOWO2_12_FULL_41_11]